MDNPLKKTNHLKLFPHQEGFSVLELLEQAEKAIKKGEVLTHEEVVRKSEEWEKRSYIRHSF